MHFFAFHTTSRRLLALSLVACASASSVHGQIVPPQEPAGTEQAEEGNLLSRVQVRQLNKQTLSDIVKRLGNDDWATREAASRELSSTLISLPMIEDVLRANDLSSEQRQRLQAAGFTSFVGSDRGALGVSFEARQAEGGIGIGRCEPGFHSHEVLRPGDIIRKIDGRAVQDLNDVRPNVITKDPGETVELDLLRDGEIQQVTLRLGSFRMLSGSMPLDGATLQVAWSNRLARLKATGATGAGLVRVPSLTATGDDATPVMISFRDREPNQSDDAAIIEAGPIATAGGKHARVTPAATEFFRQTSENALQYAEAVKQLENQQRLWEVQIRRLEDRLQEPNLVDARRARIKAEIEQGQASLREVRRQLAQLGQAQADERDDR